METVFCKLGLLKVMVYSFFEKGQLLITGSMVHYCLGSKQEVS